MIYRFAVHGVAGHAAYDEGVNAIYRAIEIINYYIPYALKGARKICDEIRFDYIYIKAGTQHNVIPDLCVFKADIEVKDSEYNEKDVIQLIRETLPEGWCDIRKARIKKDGKSENTRDCGTGN